MKRIKDNVLKSFMLGSVLSTIIILLMIIFFVVSNGIGKINIDFLTQSNSNDSYYVTFKQGESYPFNYSVVKDDKNTQVVVDQSGDFTVENKQGEEFKLQQGVVIDSINNKSFKNLNDQEVKEMVSKLNNPDQDYKVKITYEHTGIRQLILTTLLAVFVSLLIAVPLGVFAAIYLHEYRINRRVNEMIHFAIDSLAAIPSIVFGLFGFIFFCITLKLGISVLSAVLTVSIMLLPTVIKTVEEALIAVPNDLREASYGLGASKSQTIFKIVIPQALPGILLAIILSTGRIIGESAIFIFTAGTTVSNPTLFGQGATLTVNAYQLVREYNDIQTACGIGIVILVMVLSLNLITKYVSNKHN